jgi:hypothetical protein
MTSVKIASIAAAVLIISSTCFAQDGSNLGNVFDATKDGVKTCGVVCGVLNGALAPNSTANDAQEAEHIRQYGQQGQPSPTPPQNSSNNRRSPR